MLNTRDETTRIIAEKKMQKETRTESITRRGYGTSTLVAKTSLRMLPMVLPRKEWETLMDDK